MGAGVVVQSRNFFLNHHPVRSNTDASRYFLMSRPAPPGQEGRSLPSVKCVIDLDVLILAIKIFHTAVFFLLSGCILYILYCGITNRYTRSTTGAILLVILERLLLVLNGWQCPLTTLAQKLGAAQPDVASLFLPRWLADHIFEICTPLFVASSALLLIRRWTAQKPKS